MAQEILTLKNETGRPHKRIEFKFTLNRSTITSLRVERLNGTRLSPRAALPGLGQVWLDLPSPLLQGASIVLTVDYDTPEPPRLQKDSPAWGTPTNQELSAVTVTDLTRVDFSKLFSGETYASARKKWDKFIARETDPKVRRFKEFFRALDTATNTELNFAEKTNRAAKMEKEKVIFRSVDIMEAQTWIRLQSIVGGAPTKWEDLTALADPVVAKSLSDLMLPIYRRFFSTNKGHLNQEAIAEAFCRFANGELRTGDSLDENAWNCEPDSAAELHFASHSLWSIISKVDELEWTAILPCCAASQEFYMRAYYPDKAPPYLRSRYAPWNFKYPPKLTAEEIESVFRRYRWMTPQEISAQMDVNLTNLLRGNYPRSAPRLPVENQGRKPTRKKAK